MIQIFCLRDIILLLLSYFHNQKIGKCHMNAQLKQEN